MSYLEILKHLTIGAIIGFVILKGGLIIFSPKETVQIHFGENTPCILAVKAKYGCWPWDSCAKLPSEN